MQYIVLIIISYKYKDIQNINIYVRAHSQILEVSMTGRTPG